MGMKPGTPDGPGIPDKNRLKAMWGGWDITVTSVLLKRRKPRSVEAFASICTSRQATSETAADPKSGQWVTELFEWDCETVTNYAASLQEHASDRAIGTMLADVVHFQGVCYSAALTPTSVLDSGARHVNPKVSIADLGNNPHITEFTGDDKWTGGPGYIPYDLTDGSTSKSCDVDVEDAAYSEGVDCSLFSIGKMIRKGWKFTFELSGLMGWAASGHTVACFLGDDNVVCIPHMVRTGDKAGERPVPVGDSSVRSVGNSRRSDTGNWRHGLVNRRSSETRWCAICVTSGYNSQVKPFQECVYVSCATVNARSKGLTRTQYRVRMIGRGTAGNAHYLLGGSGSAASDSGETEPTLCNAKAEDSAGYEYETDPVHPSELDKHWEAGVRGRSTASKLPRFDIEKRRPWEITFANENKFDTYQRGGTKTSCVRLELNRDDGFYRKEFSKPQHGESSRQTVVGSEVRATPFDGAVYTDGCGRMLHVSDMAISRRIDHI